MPQLILRVVSLLLLLTFPPMSKPSASTTLIFAPLSSFGHTCPMSLLTILQSVSLCCFTVLLSSVDKLSGSSPESVFLAAGVLGAGLLVGEVVTVAVAAAAPGSCLVRSVAGSGLPPRDAD